MMKKVKMISVNAFERAVDNIYQPTTVVEWSGLEIVIKRHLSLAEVAKFVDVCVKACFDSDTAVYTPEAKDAAIRSCIIAFYTNITLPENVEKQYELIYHSNILDSITPNIDQNQLSSVVGAIDDKTDYLTGVNTEIINRQMSNLQDAAANIQNQLSDMFNGISIDDIKNVMSSLSDKGLDEEKLIKAYMENKSNY